MLKTKSGKTINISNCRELAVGGEGRILEHPLEKGKVLKIYHTPRKAAYAKHLEKLNKELGAMFVRPEEIYYGSNGAVTGFSMRYVNFNDYWLFNNLFNKGFCTSNRIDKAFKIEVLGKLASCIEMLHRSEITVGDLNQYNLFVNKAAEILFVDVDSYQTVSNPHSGVLLDDIRDWTTSRIGSETDIWAYDILSFWATTFCHPFKWVVPGNKETLEQRVKAHKSYLSSIAGVKIPALYEPPDKHTEPQFREIFNGRRYFVRFGTTYAPVSTVIKRSTHSVSLIIREIRTDITHIHSSSTHLAIKETTGSWVLVDASITGQVRFIKSLDCDELYPASKHYAWRKDTSILLSNGALYNFGKPVFYYNSSSLVVFDYSNDTETVIDIANQDYGTASTLTQIFAKSVIVRDAPIQNFGGLKMLNIPNGSNYTLKGVPNGTQNAIYNNGFIAMEAKYKSKVEFSIDGKIQLDYLPYFTTRGKLIMVPDDGIITVYNDYSPISQMDCPVSTKNSKLYSTTSGIFLLDNNSLYLLNTKQS